MPNLSAVTKDYGARSIQETHLITSNGIYSLGLTYGYSSVALKVDGVFSGGSYSLGYIFSSGVFVPEQGTTWPKSGNFQGIDQCGMNCELGIQISGATSPVINVSVLPCSRDYYDDEVTFQHFNDI